MAARRTFTPDELQERLERRREQDKEAHRRWRKKLQDAREGARHDDAAAVIMTRHDDENSRHDDAPGRHDDGLARHDDAAIAIEGVHARGVENLSTVVPLPPLHSSPPSPPPLDTHPPTLPTPPPTGECPQMVPPSAPPSAPHSLSLAAADSSIVCEKPAAAAPPAARARARKREAAGSKAHQLALLGPVALAGWEGQRTADDLRPWWDAFTLAMGPARTRPAAGRRAMACAELRDSRVPADDVVAACNAWANVMGDATMTEPAVVKYLDLLVYGPQRHGRSNGTTYEHRQMVVESALVHRQRPPEEEAAELDAAVKAHRAARARHVG